MKRLLFRIVAVLLPLLMAAPPVPGRADHKNFTATC